MSKTVITPPGRWDLPSVKELWEAREVLISFGRRDVLLRYRQTVIGVGWVILQPLAAAGIFAIVFGQVADLPSNGVPYFIFAFAGQLAWNVFSGVASRSSSSLVANQSLVSKVFFPRMLVPLSTILAVLVDYAVAFGLFVILLFVYGINPGWPILLLPFWTLLAVLLGAAIGVASSAVMVKYRDVGYALPWVIQILMYATPVAYSLEAVPANLLWIFNINPLTWLLEGFRWSLLGQAAPEAWQVVALVVVSGLAFTGGALIFQKLERGFADVI
ncbi:ABC transporter permease [Oerskovia jenensis]|uniref:ABC transporter permease n=1 Tax=Oerskovia jenensis TaxID=162169 RepID=UPI0036D8BDE5